eukprot:CAMPEP_0179028876 /NCGR_PEP_ID=MMETSP0796-20121207/9766_1 /TAXON_ID=73915 /ORGANISM="Pyrodinium bahamense, Strain pbaha01" /LENGTH=158 /DNA_ID=CAMNT_0020725021 /DNA_START=1 /DNA_END=473 /DNA_ORIENTATION=-
MLRDLALLLLVAQVAHGSNWCRPLPDRCSGEPEALVETPLPGFPSGDIGPFSMPIPVDWDGDDRLDLVVATESPGRLHYFQRLEDGSFFKHPDESNPFQNVTMHYNSKHAIADWDSDGDLDLIVSMGNGLIKFWNNTADGLVQCAGIACPFSDITFGG